MKVRESGNLEEAEKLFLDVYSWDEANGSPKQQADTLGHLRITCSRMGDAETDLEKRTDLRERAKTYAEKALNILEKHPEISEGSTAIANIHLASSLYDLAVEESADQEIKTKGLKTALGYIDKGIEILPGSRAHKAWPAYTKSKILYELGRKGEAWDTLLEGERNLYLGYDEEMTTGEQAKIKLNVWLSGIMINKGRFCKAEGKNELAKHYLEYVINMPDPENTLGERKKEAKRWLLDLFTLLFVNSTVWHLFKKI